MQEETLKEKCDDDDDKGCLLTVFVFSKNHKKIIFVSR